jgi:hypothetical protein
MQNFVDAVEGQTTPTNSAGQAGLPLMEMLDAIYLSSSTGREVPIARALKNSLLAPSEDTTCGEPPVSIKLTMKNLFS